MITVTFYLQYIYISMNISQSLALVINSKFLEDPDVVFAFYFTYVENTVIKSFVHIAIITNPDNDT